MSGGSYNYAFRHVELMAKDHRLLSGSTRRRAFAAQLRLVASAMKAIEWADSSDTAQGSEDGPIDDCITPAHLLITEHKRLTDAIESAKRTLEEFGGRERLELERSRE